MTVKWRIWWIQHISLWSLWNRSLEMICMRKNRLSAPHIIYQTKARIHKEMIFATKIIHYCYAKYGKSAIKHIFFCFLMFTIRLLSGNLFLLPFSLSLASCFALLKSKKCSNNNKSHWPFIERQHHYNLSKRQREKKEDIQIYLNAKISSDQFGYKLKTWTWLRCIGFRLVVNHEQVTKWFWKGDLVILVILLQKFNKNLYVFSK